MSNIRIALDAMGSDLGPEAIVPAAALALQTHKDIELIIVGDTEVLEPLLLKHKLSNNPAITIQHSSQVVSMDESPVMALRNKKDSSMRVSINLVKSGDAEGCVSAGNTGAMIATSKFVLKTISGIERPAICTPLPSIHGHTHMLDLGANIDSSSEQLYQFALMGSALATAVDDNQAPKIGLLNIGEEDTKGNSQVKEAAELLSHTDLNYVGFVEGDDIFTGDVDVVVCDGFIGNIALKSSEGLARMIATKIKAEFTKNTLSKLAGLIARPVLTSFYKKIDKRRYNGASLLGLQGVVVKSHGSADALAYANAITVCRKVIKQKLPQQISQTLARYFD